MTRSREDLLKRRPDGRPDDSCWELRERELPALEQGQVHVRVDFISLDPAMRGWMDDAASYAEPVALGEVMRALGVGEVLESRSADFAGGHHGKLVLKVEH